MKEAAIQIVRRLREAGHLAYFAGGCVRDLVRGVEPHDFDIATAATPEEVQRLFPRTVAVGAQFGVILVQAGGHSFEVATFRCDESYLDGRRPASVRYGTPEEDARRRDFTINGLFQDPLTGEIIDFVGGRADIAWHIVRAIGEPRRRFAEDKLRLLRCVRFAANLDYLIEPATVAAVREMASEVRVVSAERIRDELLKILTRPGAARGLDLLAQTGLLAVILPEVDAMRGVEQPPQFHPEGDVFTHVKRMFEHLPPDPDPVLALAVLLHDVGKPVTFQRAPDRIRFHDHDRVGAEMTEQILRRLRFPNETIARVVTCVAEHMRMQHVQEMRPAKVKRILQRPTFAAELELHRVDCLASHRDLSNYEFLKRQATELPPEEIRPAPLLTGHDLLALGLTPGPTVGTLLREAAEWQLEGRLRSRAEALAWARARVASLSGSPEAGDSG